jgi:hypothetical protein
MIHGIFAIQTTRNNFSNFIITTLSDNDQFLLQKKRKLLSFPEENLKHTLSSCNQIGVLTGEYNQRSFFLCHQDCTGLNCSCRILACDFLFNDHNNQSFSPHQSLHTYISDNSRCFQKTIDFPYLIILIDGSSTSMPHHVKLLSGATSKK